MTIVIPVLPASEAEGERARGFLEGHPCAAHLALRAKAVPGTAVRVFVQDRALRDVLAAAGLEVHFAPRTSDPGSGLGPRGGREALEFLLAHGLLEPQTPVVLADWRAAMLSPASLRRALEEATARPDGLCASLREVRESPVQCHVPQRVLFLDQFVFPESGPAARELLGRGDGERSIGLSRPFYLNWTAHDVTEDGPRWYAAAAGGHSPVIRLTAASLTEVQAGQASRVYYREGPLQARRLIDNPKPRAGVETAVPVQAGDRPSPIEVWREPGDRQVVCRVAGAAFGEEFLCRIWPLRGPAKEPGFEIGCAGTSGRGDGCAELRFAGAEDADSLIVCVLAKHCGAEYDFLEPVSSREHLWVIDPVTKARLDPATGAVLANRQQFPVLLEPDGILLAGRAATLVDPDRVTSVSPLPLAREERGRLDGDIESLLAAFGAGLSACREADRSGAVPDRKQAGASREDGPGLELALAGMLELGQALSELRAVGNARAPGFPHLRDRVERLFAAQEARLEEYVWKYDRLKDYVLKLLTRPGCDNGLDEIVDSQANRLVALNIGLKEAALEYAGILETAGAEGFGHSMTVSTPGARRPKSFLRPLARGAVPPFIPRVLASDGASRLFISAYEDRGWTGGIYVKDVVRGTLRSWGEEKRSYGAIWYDRASGRLYAMPRTIDERRAAGVDVFGDDGALLESVPFLDAAGNPLYAAYCLRGDATSLFFGDAASWSIQVLDKRNLAVEETIRIPSADYFTSFAVQDKSIYLSTRHKHIFVRRLLSGGPATVHSGVHVVFPGHMAVDQGSGIFHVVTSEHQPHAQERQEQWIKRFDADMHFIDSCRLGQQNVLDLHVVEGAQVLAVADNWEGLQLFHIC